MIRTFPLWLYGNLPANMAWELLMFYCFRDKQDGITFFELIVNLDLFDSHRISPDACSHNPKLTFALRILNYTIFEFNVYSVPRPHKEVVTKFKVSID
jgi:hypothetical protein